MPIRIRQHVNPLARKFQSPLAIPDWQDIYQKGDRGARRDPKGLASPLGYPEDLHSNGCNRPLHLDIGCARGRFLLALAQQNPEINYLGIEIRRQLVDLANQERDELGLTNLHYLFGNMNSSAKLLLESLPKNSLKIISIQFPDPWFKKKHNKRRVVQPELVTLLVEYLAVGGEIFLQSDIKEVAVEMRERFAAKANLTQKHSQEWLETNPFNVPTERELYVLGQDLPVYRVLFQKSANH
jgi:tRNA (guanine-N7-)-methyltransferase